MLIIDGSRRQEAGGRRQEAGGGRQEAYLALMVVSRYLATAMPLFLTYRHPQHPPPHPPSHPTPRKSRKKLIKARKVIDLLPEKAYLVSVERDGLSRQGGHPARKASKRKVKKDKKSR